MQDGRSQNCKKVDRNVPGMLQSQTAANPRHQQEEKKDKNMHAQNKQTNVREAQRPAPSSPSEVIRMLKQTEKRGQRAREEFKTLSAPWYKPQSYTELRTTTGPPPFGNKRLKPAATGALINVSIKMFNSEMKSSGSATSTSRCQPIATRGRDKRKYCKQNKLTNVREAFRPALPSNNAKQASKTQITRRQDIRQDST